MVGRGLHRVDQRGQGAAQLRRPLPAASAGRSRLLRPAHAGGAAPPGGRSPRRYGIEGFCVYYYNFGSRRVLSRPLETVLRQPRHPVPLVPVLGQRELDQALGRRRARDPAGAELRRARRWQRSSPTRSRQAADPRYIRGRTAGRCSWSTARCCCPMRAAFAAACRAAFARGRLRRRASRLCREHGGGGPQRSARPTSASTPASSSRRTAARCRPTAAARHRQGRLDRLPLRLSRDGARVRQPRRACPTPRYPAVFPSWDNTPRQPLRGTSFDGASPEAFRVYVEEKIEEIRALP